MLGPDGQTLPHPRSPQKANHLLEYFETTCLQPSLPAPSGQVHHSARLMNWRWDKHSKTGLPNGRNTRKLSPDRCKKIKQLIIPIIGILVLVLLPVSGSGVDLGTHQRTILPRDLQPDAPGLAP